MLKIVLLFLGNIVCNTVGNLMMKIGMKSTDGIDLASIKGIAYGVILNPVLIIGVFSYVASLGFYIFVLKKINLSIAYPISVSSTVILVTIFSSVILKESISFAQLIGTVIIFIGIFVLTR